jgi:hypothetical protein
LLKNLHLHRVDIVGFSMDFGKVNLHGFCVVF